MAYLLSAWHEAGSAECRTFRKYYSKLFEAIANPIPLAARLYSAEILPRSARDRINELVLTKQKVTELLTAAETSIWLNAQTFETFVTELNEDGSLFEELCDKMRSTCGECITLRGRLPVWLFA